MSRILHGIVGATTLLVLVACSQPDAKAAADSAGRSSANTASSPSTSAAGSVASAPTPGQPPRDTISDRADRGRLLGDTTAALWVIMASDFQCPYCKGWHDAAFQKLVTAYVHTGKVRMAFLNMPLSMHPNAVPAAEAAMCASVQNKFWPAHDALFIAQDSWAKLENPDAALEALVAKLGVNVPLWRQCYSQHLTRPLIQADHDRAVSARVNSTPTFFVGGQVLAGLDADVAGAIEAALKGRGAKPE